MAIIRRRITGSTSAGSTNLLSLDNRKYSFKKGNKKRIFLLFNNAFGDLLTFANEPCPYQVPARGDTIRHGWQMTGTALQRAMVAQREKAKIS
jgi:hypothetical protein